MVVKGRAAQREDAAALGTGCFFVLWGAVACLTACSSGSPTANAVGLDRPVSVGAAEFAGERRGRSGEGDVEAGSGVPARSEEASETSLAAGPGELVGEVRSREPGSSAKVLIFSPGKSRPQWSGETNAEGRFRATGLEPGTYRVIVPGDGRHGTADLYLEVPLKSKAVFYRPEGCPLVLTVQNSEKLPVVGAEVEVTFPDLDQVPRELLPRATGQSGEEGTVRVVGSCVRGSVAVSVRLAGQLVQELRHGYLGNGRDNFVVTLPEAPSGSQKK